MRCREIARIEWLIEPTAHEQPRQQRQTPLHSRTWHFASFYSHKALLLTSMNQHTAFNMILMPFHGADINHAILGSAGAEKVGPHRDSSPRIPGGVRQGSHNEICGSSRRCANEQRGGCI